MQPLPEIASLPLILAGPILRHTESESVTVWLALKEPCSIALEVYATNTDASAIGKTLLRGQRHTIELGKHLHLVAVTAIAIADTLLQPDRLYAYDLLCDRHSILNKIDNYNCGLSYFAHGLPTFTLPAENLDRLKIVTGSCRKPHGGGRDTLYFLDYLIQDSASIPSERPQQLFLSGDQIYGDDVANPMLWLAQRVNSLLLGWSEELPLRQGTISAAAIPPGKRSQIARIEGGMTGMLKGKDEKAKSHLLSFGEYAAAYLLAWSPVFVPENFPTGEQYITRLKQNGHLTDSSSQEQQLIKTWDTELIDLHNFTSSLPQVRRALANIAVYTICDDHDVSDDWYLNREWCDRVLSKPLGKRIVQNALLAYALFQAWGNTPSLFQAGTSGGELLHSASQWLVSEGKDETAKAKCDLYLGIPDSDLKTGLPQTTLDEDVLILARSSRAIPWHYQLFGKKHEVIVVDTRTWRGYPSGTDNKLEPPMLLCPQAFKQQLQLPLTRSSLEIEATIVVLPTNLVTLKVIDRVQQWALSRDTEARRVKRDRIFSNDVGDSWNFNHQALARLLLNLAQQRQRVIILSGDIHYSSAVRLNFWCHDPLTTSVLVQLTSSAFKNSEAATLLAHTKLKALFPESTERWLGWNHPLQLKQIAPSWGRNRKLERNTLPQWQYTVEWCDRNRAILLPWQPAKKLSHQSSWWQKLLAILIFWLWRNRWFQEGTQIIGRNNLSLIMFSWGSEKMVIQENYWHPEWDDSAVVKSSYRVALKLNSLPSLPK